MKDSKLGTSQAPARPQHFGREDAGVLGSEGHACGWGGGCVGFRNQDQD